MTDLILQIGATKLALSVALACVAWVVQRRIGLPSLSWALWLLLLAALLTPPLIALPVLSPVVEPAAAGLFDPRPPAPAIPTPTVSVADWLWLRWEEGLALGWLLGICVVAVWSLFRTLRFHRHLQEGSTVAPDEVQQIAGELAEALGLANTPTIRFTGAHVAPLVWWVGGRPRVVVPSILWRELDGAEVRCILAHELAHVRRRDHLVRWIEWLACTVFWWNPLAWWARRRLRAVEEFCCDALVASSLPTEPRVYAGTLLRVIELMSATTALRPPTFASTVSRSQRGKLLEGRLRMIVTAKPPASPRWLLGSLRVVTACVLLASVVYCTNQAGPASADPALTPTEGDARGDRAVPTRRVAARIATHLDRLLAEGPAGPNVEALAAAFEGRRLPAGMPQYFLVLSKAGEGGDNERVVVDLSRLREALAETDPHVSQKDLEAVIRRSAPLKRAGWTFKSVFGFSGAGDAETRASVQFQDVDGDGHQDLWITATRGTRTDFFLGDGDGRFTRAMPHAAPAGSRDPDPTGGRR